MKNKQKTNKYINKKKANHKTLVVALVAFLLGGLTTYAAQILITGEGQAGTPYLGKSSAKVEFIEYGSLGCKHCKEMHDKIFPSIKSEFIDSGKVKYQFKPFINNPSALNAAMALDCVDKDKYYKLVDTLYSSQQVWAGKDSSLQDLKFAVSGILGDADFSTCLQNEVRKKEIIDAFRSEAMLKGINSSPTYLVNGERIIADNKDGVAEAINLALQDKSPSSAREAAAKEILAIRPSDRVFGNAEASVTIIEYASLSCPHCAKFHNEILPQVKKEYIESGKVKLIFRDFPLNEPALKAATLARCAESSEYYNILKTLFSTQKDWAFDKINVSDKLKQIAAMHGINASAYESCMANKEIETEVLSMAQEAKKIGVQSTPSFFLNGVAVEHLHNIDEFRNELDKLIK